jgi:hypothetical protein
MTFKASALIRRMTSLGVRAGALRPFHATAWKPFSPTSSSVGMSGSAPLR